MSAPFLLYRWRNKASGWLRGHPKFSHLSRMTPGLPDSFPNIETNMKEKRVLCLTSCHLNSFRLSLPVPTAHRASTGTSAGLQAPRNTCGAGFLAAEGLLKQLLGLGAPVEPIQLRWEVNQLVEP